MGKQTKQVEKTKQETRKGDHGHLRAGSFVTVPVFNSVNQVVVLVYRQDLIVRNDTRRQGNVQS